MRKQKKRIKDVGIERKSGERKSTKKEEREKKKENQREKVNWKSRERNGKSNSSEEVERES